MRPFASHNRASAKNTARPPRHPAVFAAALLLCLFICRQAPAADLFGHPELAAPHDHPHHRLFNPHWQRVLAEERQAPAFTATGDNFNSVDAETWCNLVKYVQDKSETDILRLVNGYFNQWPPKSDEQLWNLQEYWETPREFMNTRGGDCEDYAIAKYFALRFFGFQARDMRIAVVLRRTAKGENLPELHAVLAVRSSNTWFVLDNNSRPRDGITPHEQYRDRFVPIYSVNEDNAWIYKSKKNKAATATTP